MSKTAIAEKKKKIVPAVSVPEQDRQSREGITTSVQAAGETGFTVDRATPPAETNVLDEQTAEAVGATHVGSEKFTLEEDLGSKGRFLGRVLRALAKPFRGGNVTSHQAPGIIGEKLSRDKANKEVPDKYDPNQLNELE